MLDLDTLLQEKLDALESGQPLEVVLESLPPEAAELEALIRLASAVRTAPHPEPVNQQVTAQRSRIMAAAEIHTRPVRRQPVPQTVPARPRPAFPWLGRALAFSAIAALFLCVALAFLGGSWLNGRSGSTARLENVTGQVQIATDANGENWKNVTSGEPLRRGQRLRTLGASSAMLVFFEGTRTYVGPNADLTLTQAGRSGSALQVEITQNHGSTSHQVIPLKGANSYFRVLTPSGTASVHGTSFNVRVNTDGYSQISVNRGEVLVSNENAEVTLLAGQATAAEPGMPPADPTYQFTIQGSLIARRQNAWVVSGVEFEVGKATSISGSPQLGTTIRVTGRVMPDGYRIADSIEVASNSTQVAFFTGPIESMAGESWQIGGKTVLIDPSTTIDEGLEPGDPVQVSFNVLGDGSWLALKIESLEESPIEPTAVPSATPAAGAMPSLSFEPDELGAPGCDQNQLEITGTLRNTSNSTKDFAANVQLGYLILSGGEYVQSVEINPNAWSRIAAGEKVSYSVNVTLNNDFQAAGNESEVKLRVFVAQETNRPDHHDGRATVTLTSSCNLEATQTPIPTQAPTLEETLTGTNTPEATETTVTETVETPTPLPTTLPPTQVSPEAGVCPGGDPHPTGLTLAQRYGVPYEEIMYWFCQHYGFGEIDLAYSLSLEANIPVDQVFEMRRAGIGWGEIKKQLAPDEDQDDGQDEDQDDDQEEDNNNSEKEKDKEKDKDKDNNKDKNKDKNNSKKKNP